MLNFLVKNGYAVYNSLLNHGLDFRAEVIKCLIDETTKVSDVNKYFNFIVQKLTMQARKKISYFKLICKLDLMHDF